MAVFRQPRRIIDTIIKGHVYHLGVANAIFGLRGQLVCCFSVHRRGHA